MSNKTITSADWPAATKAAREPGVFGDTLGPDILGPDMGRNPGFDGHRDAQASREKTVATVRLLWNARPFMLRCTFLGFVVSLLIAFLIPSRFTSSTRLMPPDQASSNLAMLASAASGKAGANVGAFAGDLLGLKSSGALFVGILQGRTVRDDLITVFNLRQVYGAKRWESARDELGQNTRISEDTKSGIITIAVSDKSPERAAALAQEYVRELDRVVTAVNTTSAHRERVFLGERLAEVQADLEAAEKRLSDFASENSAVDIQAQGKALIEAGAALEGELIAAQTELEGLKQVYAEGNVRVRATRAKVQELQRQLDKVGGRDGATGVATDGATDIAADAATNRATASTSDKVSRKDASAGGGENAPAGHAQDNRSAYPSLRKLPLLGVSYADLFRATKIQETVFETLTEQYELAKVEEAKETPSVKVIDLPDVPENKSSPHRAWIALAGAGACFLLSSLWIAGGDYWRQIDPQDSGKVLTLEMLASMKMRWPFQGTDGHGHT